MPRVYKHDVSKTKSAMMKSWFTTNTMVDTPNQVGIIYKTRVVRRQQSSPRGNQIKKSNI